MTGQTRGGYVAKVSKIAHRQTETASQVNPRDLAHMEVAHPNTSSFALLDIKRGRRDLAKRCGRGLRTPIIIKGYIQEGEAGVGHDDGTSREFSVTVEELQMGDPVPAPRLTV